MRRLIALSIFLFTFAQSSWAEGIRLYTENFKPYQFTKADGQLDGFGIELIKALFKEADIKPMEEIRMGIWDHVYHSTLKENNAAVFMTVRNTKREALFQWVGPLASREMWLYKRSDRKDIAPTTLHEAKPFLIGGYKSAQTDYLQELGFLNLDIVLKEELNLKKLLAGRIDMMPSLAIQMESKLKYLGLPISSVEKVVLFDDRYDYYLALNKNVPVETVQKLQKALDRLKRNGIYQKIESRYLTVTAP